jgi:hypothetical protein
MLMSARAGDPLGEARLAAFLRGSKPLGWADWQTLRILPVQMPSRCELVINLNTGKALRLTISHSILARADEVIE